MNARTAQQPGLNDVAFTETTLYPNPATKEITVQYTMDEQSESAIITIYDMLGAIVMEKSLPDSNTTLQLGDLSSGIYIYFIKQGSQTIKTDKLIINK